MKKLVPPLFGTALTSLAKIIRLKTCVCTVVVLLAGCTYSQVRWDATQMRKDVMVYYNEQIMDNLVKARNNLPFVHVDIQQLTSLGSSQISGSIGNGETRTHATSSVAGVIGTITRTVTRPFSYSVTPQRSETLTITASPALGNQALASPTPSDLPTPTPAPTPKMEITKETEIQKTEDAGTSVTAKTPVSQKTTEKTLKPAPQPAQITIYKLYRDFAALDLTVDPNPPKKDDLVPGSVVKRWDKMYYYVHKDKTWAYYKFCTALFTKGGGGSLEDKVKAARADVEAVRAILGTPVAPTVLPPQ
jgi:hypothetical protein